MLCARHGFVHVSVKKIIRDSAAECISGKPYSDKRKESRDGGEKGEEQEWERRKRKRGRGEGAREAGRRERKGCGGVVGGLIGRF